MFFPASVTGKLVYSSKDLYCVNKNKSVVLHKMTADIANTQKSGGSLETRRGHHVVLLRYIAYNRYKCC